MSLAALTARTTCTSARRVKRASGSTLRKTSASPALLTAASSAILRLHARCVKTVGHYRTGCAKGAAKLSAQHATRRLGFVRNVGPEAS